MFPADVQTIRENILVHTYWPISIAISGTEAELRCYARGIPWYYCSAMVLAAPCY